DVVSARPGTAATRRRRLAGPRPGDRPAATGDRRHPGPAGGRRADPGVPLGAVPRGGHGAAHGAGDAPLRPVRLGRLDPLGDVGRALLRLGAAAAVLLGGSVHVQGVRPGRRRRIHRRLLRRRHRRREVLL
ncbi:MAG: hypothetical protein AVDCRST_MAG52-1683, partial [uncultured Blastococcus sp.]